MASPAEVAGLARPKPTREDLRLRDERLESLGLLAGSIAHDFNNLLAPILGYSTLIKEEFPADSSGLQYAQSLETAARRAEKNIEQTLLATRPQRRFTPRPLEFDKLITSEVAKWQQELPPNSALQISVEAPAAELTADDYHWRVAIRHLLNNARFGCAIGGRISVKLELITVPEAEMAELGLPETENYRLQVSDTGSGLTPEVMFRAYDPFYTTRAKGATLGLGLTACHSITYLHGGQIAIQSKPDEGTVVTIWLPRTFLAKQAPPPTLDTAPRMPMAAPSAPIPRKRALLLADDVLEREVLKSALIKAGLETMTPEDRPGAKRLFERLHKDLVFVLASFGQASATEFSWLKQMQDVNNTVPIFILSSEDKDKTDTLLAAQNISAVVLPKPILISQLIGRLPISR